MSYERMLIDLTVNGETRKALVTTGKLGIIEAIDRTNGAMALAQGDGATERGVGDRSEDRRQDHQPGVGSRTSGRPPSTARPTRAAVAGPRPPTARRPACSICRSTSIARTRRRPPLDPGQAYTGGGRAVYARVPIPNSDGKIGRVEAVKLADQSTAWSYRTRAPQTGAVLPTGGGLVFSGAWDRYFRAFDDTTGEVLWQITAQQRRQLVPGHLYGERQAVCRGLGRQRLEPGALARDADARAAEPGRRLGALGVRAAGLISLNFMRPR